GRVVRPLHGDAALEARVALRLDLVTRANRTHVRADDALNRFGREAAVLLRRSADADLRFAGSAASSTASRSIAGAGAAARASAAVASGSASAGPASACAVSAARACAEARIERARSERDAG